VPYLPLPNFNHDSGPRRIQSGPDHEGYVVLYSGVQSIGPDNGFVVAGAPLSGTPSVGGVDYDSNWRYVPSTTPKQSESLDPTPYNVSGALDTYHGTRIYTRDNVAGAQAASAIGPETGKVNPRGGALQPRADVTRPETYMYYGGAAPDNQDYSPYNTPDANSAAEGKTGGGVTHRSYESTLLTNVLGSQGTSDRSQWRYHQPVYCKTYTETRRSETPGLMSTPLRYVYRGPSTSYNYNYGGELLASKGGFEILSFEETVFTGCPFPLPVPQNSTGDNSLIQPGNILSITPRCPFINIQWFTSASSTPVGSGTTYTVSPLDVGYTIFAVVTYSDGSTAVSPATSSVQLVKKGEQTAPCVAVIDETTPSVAVQTTDWDAFRANWPLRPFNLMIPSSTIDQVNLPIGYNGTVSLVNRDNGNVALRSDWFALAGFGTLPSGQQVFLFVDNSGSMTTNTVLASYNLFLSKCSAAGLPVASVTNTAERYIQPFINALVPT
jgi:hypothetical protein